MLSFPTNMNNVTGIVQHDVSIMSILDLKEIYNYRIGGHAPNKIVPGLEKNEAIT
jgi:hypothetical protein